MIETMIDLLDKYCGGCHTNHDWDSCDKCPTGNLINHCKTYVLEISIDHSGTYKVGKVNKIDTTITAIQKIVKRVVKPHPFFNNGFLDEDSKYEDTLEPLKRKLSELKHWNSCYHRKIMFKLSDGEEEKELKNRFKKYKINKILKDNSDD